ncbi:MAG: phosphatase PAP2 family protein [Verrucomicrobia bacterium]|nr:phosphatase PAP2 family protein [Verrucomicrobiota bacterium]
MKTSVLCAALAALCLFTPTAPAQPSKSTAAAQAPARPRGFPGGQVEAFGPKFSPTPSYPFPERYLTRPLLDMVRRWNELAINATGLDHTPVGPGESRVFGEQLGPARASRAMAIIHLAMFEASNAIVGGYASYAGVAPVAQNTSFDAAVAQAARDTLAALYPSQTATFDTALATDLARIRSLELANRGVALGRTAAAAVLALRASDGSAHAEQAMGTVFIPSNLPGRWRQDPVSLVPIALGALWNTVTPFVMQSAAQFRLPPPPALNTPEYTAAYNEAKALGGDGITTPTQRGPRQTFIGTFWAYDGTPSLCAPPRLYNQIAVDIADQQMTTAPQLARLLALLNVAMADTGIAAWDSKYFYQYWRPVTGIRESDPGTGPTGAGDDNPNTVGDPTFSPLGAPASNLTGPNFTPPFPAYPSGHAAFGGALFQTLRRFYGTDALPFTFVSDEYNGLTKDRQGNVRPRIPRTFQTLSQAEEENGQSRIYLGIHWSFDKTGGITQGRNVANWVWEHILQPVP